MEENTEQKFIIWFSRGIVENLNTDKFNKPQLWTHVYRDVYRHADGERHDIPEVRGGPPAFRRREQPSLWDTRRGSDSPRSGGSVRGMKTKRSKAQTTKYKHV